MTITIISDCKDNNAVGRQVSRASALFGAQAFFVGVHTDLEASGNIIDILDALENKEAVVLANVAPRSGPAKKWPNGTPFGYFRYKNVLVVSSVDGLTLSLVKKFGLTEEIQLLDIPTVLDAAVADGRMASEVRDHVVKGQFRSFDFVPRVAHYLHTGFRIPSETINISQVPDAPSATIWWVDNFGNCKTTLLASDTNYKPGEAIDTKFGIFKYYERLKDVPNNETAIIEGSSGLDDRRFIELVTQGGNVASQFNVSTGFDLLENNED